MKAEWELAVGPEKSGESGEMSMTNCLLEVVVKLRNKAIVSSFTIYNI